MIEAGETAAFVRAVGNALRAARLQRGLQIKQLALLVTPCGPQISRLESGQRHLDTAGLVELCAALHVSPTWVIAAAERDAFPLGWPGYVRDIPEPDRPAS